jgi:radical SAM superfamily enzyme YgiQ (UPF0313 family)
MSREEVLKVLLVSANTETITMPVLPLGLGYVAAATQIAGYDIKLLNLLDQNNSLSLLKTTVHEFRPDVIGISVRNIDDQNMECPRFLLGPVKTIISECRKISNAIIVIGGAGYSIFPQAALDYLDADMGIQGEGEVAFLELLNMLNEKKEPFGIPGLYFPGRQIHYTPKRIKRLADHPLPLPNIHSWTHSAQEDENIWLPVQTRRGCPMNCSYCSTALIEGRTIRKYPPEKVVEMISQFVDSGFDRFFFVDNTFNLPSSYAKSLCVHLVGADLNIIWRCILYPWKVDEELVKWMARAGCTEVALGCESGCEQILRTMNKQFNVHEVRRISQILKDYGIRQTGFLLLGGPGETKESVKESLFFADSLNIETVKVTVGIRIYPHTALAETAVRQGLISVDDDLLYPKFYLDRKLEKWLPKTVKSWVADRQNWIS